MDDGVPVDKKVPLTKSTNGGATKAKVGSTVRMVANLDNVHFFEKDTPDNRALR